MDEDIDETFWIRNKRNNPCYTLSILNDTYWTDIDCNNTHSFICRGMNIYNISLCSVAVYIQIIFTQNNR